MAMTMVLRAHTINTDIMQLARCMMCLPYEARDVRAYGKGDIKHCTGPDIISFMGGGTMKWPKGDTHINKKVTKGHQKVDQK